MTFAFVKGLAETLRTGHGRSRRRPSELAALLAASSGRERAELMAIISRHDAWDEVDGR